jgi:GNAT superfamily N-acetyltransferase
MSAPAIPAKIEIRAARPRDFPPIAELAGQLGYPSTVEDIARRFAAMKNSAEHDAFVAELSDGRIAGWVGVFVQRTVESDACVEISGLVVDERCRSRGVGLRLLERAEQWAHEKGCSVVRLRSNVIRGRAHAFYERQGYEHIKTQKAFRKNL